MSDLCYLPVLLSSNYNYKCILFSCFQYHAFTGLKPFTHYLIQVLITNEIGQGPPESRVLQTEEGSMLERLFTQSNLDSVIMPLWPL